MWLPRPRRPSLLAGAVVVLVGVLGLVTPAGATWSLVATDPGTGEAGVALASCVPAEILGDPAGPLVPVVVVPASLAAVTQGNLNLAAPPRIRELAAVGAEPAQVVDDITAPGFDPEPETRQHAVVDLDGRTAAFTGADLSASALDRQEKGVSVQGNLLVSDQVVDDALAAFTASRDTGADLATALVDGLVAGSRAGGDRRCPDQTALFAQLVVAGPGDPPDAPATVLTVTVDPDDGQNPVELLASARADGRTGRLDLGQGDDGNGGLVRALAGGVALLMVAGGVVAFRLGMGSRRARR